MTKKEYLDIYTEGWANGDTEKVLQAVAPSYQYGDTQDQVALEKFREYHRNLINKHVNTMSITGVVAYEVEDKLIAGFLFEAGSFRGIGLITVCATTIIVTGRRQLG